VGVIDVSNKTTVTIIAQLFEFNGTNNMCIYMID